MKFLKFRFRLFAFFLVLAVFVSWPQMGRADLNPRMVDILITSNTQSVLLYARLLDGFKPEMESAILAGVPVVFVISVDVYQERTFPWDKKVSSREIRRAIKYDNLKKTFTITTNGNQAVSFSDYESAQKAMAELSGLAVVSLAELIKGHTYSAHIKVKLDKVKLPLSMEYVFFFVSLWDQETPLYNIRFSY